MIWCYGMAQFTDEKKYQNKNYISRFVFKVAITFEFYLLIYLLVFNFLLEDLVLWNIRKDTKIKTTGLFSRSRSLLNFIYFIRFFIFQLIHYQQFANPGTLRNIDFHFLSN